MTVIFLLLALSSHARPKLKYKSHEQIRTELQKRCDVSMLSKDSCDKLLAIAPQGGSIEVYFTATSIEAGNSKNLYYIIEFEGKEVYRRQGSNIIPTPQIIQGITWWTCSDFIYLDKHYKGSITIHVVDNTYQERFTYTIDTVTGKVLNVKK